MRQQPQQVRPPVPAHRRVGEHPRGLREHLIERLRPRGMPVPGPHPRIIHDSQHAPSLARQDRQITQPRQSRHAVVVLEETSMLRRPAPQALGAFEVNREAVAVLPGRGDDHGRNSSPGHCSRSPCPGAGCTSRPTETAQRPRAQTCPRSRSGPIAHAARQWTPPRASAGTSASPCSAAARAPR